MSKTVYIIHCHYPWFHKVKLGWWVEEALSLVHCWKCQPQHWPLGEQSLAGELHPPH